MRVETRGTVAQRLSDLAQEGQPIGGRARHSLSDDIDRLSRPVDAAGPTLPSPQRLNPVGK